MREITSRLALAARSCYTTQAFNKPLRVMYDDYDLDYTFSNDYTLDEDTYAEFGTSDLDEDYARDGQDYESLAYRHYA